MHFKLREFEFSISRMRIVPELEIGTKRYTCFLVLARWSRRIKNPVEVGKVIVYSPLSCPWFALLSLSE